MTERVNILITSIGNRGYLARDIRHAMRGEGKVYAGNSIVTAALSEADEAVITPGIYSEEYIPFLLDYCSSHRITAILSVFDLDVRVLAHNKRVFEEAGITVIAPDETVVDLCQDKWAMYLWLVKNGIYTPKTYKNILRAIRDMQSYDLFLPVVVKPRFGMGSIGLYDKIQTVGEMKLLYKRSGEEIETALQNYGLPEPEITSLRGTLVQERIQGTEYSLDIICDLDGSYRNTVVKRKLGMRAGETAAAEIVDDPKLKELGRCVAIILKPVGCLDMDVMVDSGGMPYVLEINPRIGGGYPFTYMSGVDIPEAIICWLKDRSVDSEALHLRETVGITGQKTIVPAMMVDPSEILIQRCADEGQIYKTLIRLERYLTPSLTARGIAVNRYALKLAENAHVWIAQNRQEEPVGMIAVYGGSDAYGTFLAVDPAYRRMHIARRMFTVAMETLAAEGTKTFSFEVRQKNTAAINMYLEQGCSIIAVEKDVYRMKKVLREPDRAA